MENKSLLGVELDILFPSANCNFPDDFPDSVKDVVQYLTSGDYQACLQFCSSRLPYLNLSSVEELRSLGERIQNSLSETKEESNKLQREIEVLSCAVSCLQLFVVSNWTGPIKADIPSILPYIKLNKADDEILHLLEEDGESIYSLVEAPILLYIAKMTFEHSDCFHICKMVPWWSLRYISIHQQLLKDRSPTLHAAGESIIRQLQECLFVKNEAYRSYTIQMHLAAGLLQLHCYQYKEAERHFQTACDLTGIDCTLDGALGVRTRFQQKALPQLRVRAVRSKVEIHSTCPVINEADIAKALPLDDDTVLEAVKFTDDDEETNPVLSPEEQATVLITCTRMQKTSPSHILRDEELKCFIEFLLTNPKSWSVHMEALRVRCNLEKHKRRTVERSMMQLESLVKNLSPKQSRVPSNVPDAILKRLSLFYSVWPKPSWVLEKQLAELFESLGARSSALEIYTRLHMWEEAIFCLIRTGRGGDAENLIREQLAVKETPVLYCLLGDVLQDPTFYEKAWQLSNRRNARAMRSLGAYHVSKKMYQEAVKCFEKSLKINYLQVGAWFSMGCAALASEDYEKAAKSFQKCVSLNWDNYEAWTNLSTAFIRCNKKDQAFRALKEGLKCNFARWELWENFLFVSTDTGHFHELIQAYNRLLDLKEKYIDVQVLSVLVKAICEEIPDANEISASKVKPKALELFGRLTSKVTSNWEVWHLYARLLRAGSQESGSESNERAFNYLQKALRSGAQRTSWEKDPVDARKMTDLSLDVLEACIHRIKSDDVSEDQKKTLLTSTRLTVNGVKAKLMMHEKEVLNQDLREGYSTLSAELVEKLSLLEANI